MRCARSLSNPNRRLVVPLPADNGGRFFRVKSLSTGTQGQGRDQCQTKH